jgi:signal transduction histidine kinase
MELVSSPIQPRSLAERWHRQIGILADSKGLNFKLEVDENLPTLLGDEEALSKIGINLLSNAVKFTHQGQVTLRMRRAAHDLWHIEVEDTGIGIPLHAREYIFDEFRQVDQSSKRLYGGTGLGLAIVQKLTRLMGGTVSVQSEVGRGSIFTVALPLTCAAGN